MSGYTGPINRNPGPGEAAIIIYGYTPSLAPGIVGAVTFLLVAFVQLWYLVRKRGHRSFHALILVGSLMELGGYVARSYAHYRPYLVSAFVAQYFLIVVAPVVFSAAIYLSLTLLVNGFERAEKLLIIKPRTLLICFVTFDAVCTVIQVAGAALIGTSQSARVQGKYSKVTPEQANDILLAGLAIQTFSFVTFLSILSVALYRALRSTFPGPGVVDTKPYKRMRVFLWVILITSDLILLRTLFRLAETAQGFFGTAATSEVLFACLEYLPVILAVIVWSVFPPSRFVDPQGRVVERTPRFEDKHQAGVAEQAGVTPEQATIV